MMEVFRLSKSLYANDLTGFGAKKYGARWNPKGVAVNYAASSRALATLEFLVHMTDFEAIPKLRMLTIEIPGTPKITKIAESSLPPDWKHYEPPAALAEMGRQWASSRESLVLAVPSVVIPSESNFLINPEHPDFQGVRITFSEDFYFDERLLKRLSPK